MTAVTDSGSTFAYAYTLDMADRPASIVAGIAGLTPAVTFNQTFDDAGRRAQLAAALDSTDDFVNDYLYDGAGRMTRISQYGEQGGNTVAEKRFDFAYDAVSRFDTLTRYNNVAGTQTVAVSTYTFDNADRLTALAHAKGETSLASYSWTFDDGGRITAQNFTSAVGDHGNSTYSYDSTNQITAADYASDWQTDESYSYDENGNRTNNGFTVGANNLLTGDGTYKYTYDNEGNRVARFVDNDSSGTLNSGDTNITLYTWDHRNRLTSVMTFATYGGNSTKETTLLYDNENRWLKRVVDPDGASGSTEITQRVFIYDGTQIVLQFDKTDTGSLTASDRSHRYVWGPNVDQILADGDLSGGMGAGSQSAMGSKKANAKPGLGKKKASASPPVVRWPLCDHINSVRDIANYESGTDTTTVINHRVYDSFGKLISETNSSIPHLFFYTARPLDTSTSLQNNLHRWYDALVAKWLSEDHIWEDDNPYRYVRNRPMRYVDPKGWKLQAPTDIDQPYFEGLLNQLCPEGKFEFSTWDNAYSTVPNFCTVGETSTPGLCEQPKCLTAKHKVSCKCICDAINSKKTISLYVRPRSMGDGTNLPDLDVPEIIITPGTRAAGGCPPIDGCGDSTDPTNKTVRDPDWIIFGHELCGHAVPGVSGSYTAIDVENQIREEHSTPTDNLGTRHYGSHYRPGEPPPQQNCPCSKKK